MTDDTDLTDPHGEAEALRKENERLRAEIAEATDPEFIWGALDNVHDAETTLDDYAAAVSRAQRAALAASRAPDPVAKAGSCQPGDLISRAAAVQIAARWEKLGLCDLRVGEAIRALPAAPVAKAKPVVHTGAFPDRIVLYAKTDDFGVVGCAEDIWLDPVQDVVEISTRVRNQRAEIREYVPADAAPVAEAQPTIGGAELDALAAQAMTPHTVAAHQVAAALHRQTVDPLQSYVTIEQCLEYGQRIRDAALRAQPDWKAMAERLGKAIRALRSARFAAQFYEADQLIDAALADLARIKGE